MIIKNIIFFDNINNLCELTGLNSDELTDINFEVCDLDFGFELDYTEDRKTREKLINWLDTVDDGCFNHVDIRTYNNKMYYLFYRVPKKYIE